MTAQPITRKLKQARLGTLQRQVLVMLAAWKAEGDTQGTQRDTGVTHREILAGIHGYAVIDTSQWLPSVFAQIQRHAGEDRAGTLTLGGYALRVLELTRGETIKSIDAAQRQDADDWMAVEGLYLFTQRLHKLERIDMELRGIQRLAGDPVAYQPWLFEAMLHTVRRLMHIVNHSGGHVLTRARDLSAMGTDEEATAAGALGVQQASLSRAFRLLREHDLITKEEVQLTRLNGAPNGTEERYYITQKGLARLRTSQD